MLGVFDSGLGGLSAVKELTDCLPNEDIVYFGDTGRVPYGTRSKNTILKYAAQDIHFLMQFNPKAILVACGTVTSVALPFLKEQSPVPVVGVVDAAVRSALRQTKNGKIAVLGTPATIRSGSYQQGLKVGGAEVIATACPLFVPLVENGHLNDDIVAATVRCYLKDAVAFGADTIVLGCTHYPLLGQAIASYVGEDVTLINAAAEGAGQLKQLLIKEQLLSADGGRQMFYVSDSTERFAETAKIFLQRDIEEAVKQIDIETY